MSVSYKKILLVEDDESICEAMSACLEDAGYVVNSCSNGQMALDYLNQDITELPGLIILDLMMPIIDGYEFRKAQLADNKLCNIPVIVMSAGNIKIAGNYLFRELSYLPKPLDLDDLFSHIQKILD